MPRLQTLKPQIRTAPGRIQMAATLSTQRIRGSKHQKTRDRIMSRDLGVCRCAVCQRTDALKEAHEVEHRTPLWAGGQEDDGNRYAINRDCHKAKTECETRMRAAGGWLSTPCTCGQHSTAQNCAQGAAVNGHHSAPARP